MRRSDESMPRRDEPIDTLMQRARAEFREMPGLRLTFQQIQRLWVLDRTTCTALVERLLQDKILTLRSTGHYVRFGSRQISSEHLAGRSKPGNGAFR